MRTSATLYFERAFGARWSTETRSIAFWCAHCRLVFAAAGVDFCSQFEASRPSDYRTSTCHILQFSHFIGSRRDDDADVDAPKAASAPVGASRVAFTFPPDSSAFFALDEGEHFQTFLINLTVRTGPTPAAGASGSGMRYAVGSGRLNYTIETATTPNQPVASTSAAPQPLPAMGNPGGTPYANSTTRLRSDVSVLEGLERVWREWFDGPARFNSLSTGLNALALASPPVDLPRLPTLRSIEVETMTANLATYPSVPFTPGALADGDSGLSESAKAASRRLAAEAMSSGAGQGQRLFEMAWQDLECDVPRILVALEEAEHAR